MISVQQTIVNGGGKFVQIIFNVILSSDDLAILLHFEIYEQNDKEFAVSTCLQVDSAYSVQYFMFSSVYPNTGQTLLHKKTS